MKQTKNKTKTATEIMIKHQAKLDGLPRELVIQCTNKEDYEQIRNQIEALMNLTREDIEILGSVIENNTVNGILELDLRDKLATIKKAMEGRENDDIKAN